MNAQPNTRAPEYEEADRQTAPQASAQRTVLPAPRAWQGHRPQCALCPRLQSGGDPCRFPGGLFDLRLKWVFV